MALDFTDRTDFENAERGFIATLDAVTITDSDGRAVFDLSGYDFLDDDCPPDGDAEPVPAGPTLLRQWVVRSHRRDLPDSRIRHLQHDLGGR